MKCPNCQDDPAFCDCSPISWRALLCVLFGAALVLVLIWCAIHGTRMQIATEAETRPNWPAEN